ncbi:probable sodium/metabolite cotransporter BASS4, chloroplastic [Telopea speciosissima]|uniref:probable sodium/metabolite cotransporter BASS4, chloroplastic n=1 Tax=Telopea speciosissima TaxID=54955 RepID=UPI001CC39444|nr:probable sodium/metabolite cotransporter BASS4, chloroplastic [Telopea speciosissima]
MAGTLQTLVYRHATVSNGNSCQRKHIVPAHYILFRGTSLACSPNSSILWKSGPLSRTIRAKERFDQVDHDRNQNGRIMDSATELSWAKSLLDFAATNFLPIALVGGIALGLANPGLGCLANKYSVSKFSTFGIFLISGLTLQSKEISAAVKAWPAGLFGLVSILLLTPFLSRIILQLKLSPQEFVTGLAIFSCMPTTLSSGVALTQLVGGNSALALAMTVISNLLGIFIVPLSLSKFIAAGVGVPVPTEQLFRSLIATLLVPLILGKVTRDIFNGVAECVDQNRKLFSMISAIFLSLVPWIQVSRSRPLLLMVKPAVFFVAILMGTVLHLILLALNALLIKILSSVPGGRESVFAKKENTRAVVIVASQKTLPVMVAVVEQLGGALGESGLLVLPCVAAHINQIIVDSFLVNFWLQKDQSSNNAKEA